MQKKQFFKAEIEIFSLKSSDIVATSPDGIELPDDNWGNGGAVNTPDDSWAGSGDTGITLPDDKWG